MSQQWGQPGYPPQPYGWQQQQPGYGQPPTLGPRRQRNMAILAVAAVLGVMVLLGSCMGAMVYLGNERKADERAKQERERKAEEARPKHTKLDAWVMVQQFVKDRLKSPRTADFGSVLDGTFQRPDDVCKFVGNASYQCAGWVDSQNSFGATVRTRFTARVRWEGGAGDKWSLTSLEMK